VEARSPTDTANSYYEHKLTIYGDLTNKGSFDLRGGSTAGGTANGVLTTFAGTTHSTLYLNYKAYQSSNEEFNGITIDKSGSGKVILATGNLFMNNSSSIGPALLTLKHGIVETGNNILVFLATNSTGIIGASPLSYVNGTLGRGMNSSGKTEKIFYIGDSLGFRPITIRTTTGSTSGHFVYAKIVTANANTGSSALSADIDSVSHIRYYQIGYNKGTGTVDTMCFQQFTPTYDGSDSLREGPNGLSVAYSINGRITWTGIGPSNHATDLSAPPTLIQSNTIDPVISLKDTATLCIALAHLKGGNTGLIPDSSNASYGTFSMNKYDFWKAKSAVPTPLVIYIHGGGFTQGSKEDISQNLISGLLTQGISVMSINYRLTPEVIIPQHYLDCARAIQFVRYNAEKFNIDPTKIAGSGSSAGACTAFWLGFHDDLKDAANSDPVLRMSTRLACMANWSGQTSIDERIISDWIGPMVLQFSYFTTGAVFGLSPDRMQSPTPEDCALFEMASPINHLTTDDPPVWMYYSYVDPPQNSSEAIHHINFGRHLKSAMDSLSIPCVLLDPSYASNVTNSAVDFFVRYLKTTTRVNGTPRGKRGYELAQNYPNPFNPSTVISYSLPESGKVNITVYDILGNEIAALVNAIQAAGTHQVVFNAAGLPSGVYFARMNAGQKMLSEKMLLIK
jgi:acetyl esterase/lipase